MKFTRNTSEPTFTNASFTIPSGLVREQSTNCNTTKVGLRLPNPIFFNKEVGMIFILALRSHKPQALTNCPIIS